MRRTLAVLEEQIARGDALGAQIYIARGGEVLLDEGIGESAPGVAMDRNTINLWMSAGKPLTAVAFAQLWEQKRVGLDVPVAEWIPEFAQGGKAGITPRHVLTHTGGFIGGEIAWRTAWDEALRMVCAIERPADWEPGERAGYHALSSWYVLGELVQRVSGGPLQEYLQQHVFGPAGMEDCWMGMPGEAFAAYGARMGKLFKKTEEGLKPAFHEAEDAAVTRPGSNARGPIRGLGRFYAMLLNEGRCAAGDVLTAPTVSAMTARQRVGMHDTVFRADDLDMGLGFFIDGKWHGRESLPYGFGPGASRRTFGHGGIQSAIGFGDPEQRLAVAWTCNGMIGEPAHQRRNHAINAAIYEDLGIAGRRGEQTEHGHP